MEKDELIRWSVALIKENWSHRQPPRELPADSVIEDTVIAIINAAQQPLAPDGLHCPVCQQVAGTYLACSYCHSEITPTGKA